MLTSENFKIKLSFSSLFTVTFPKLFLSSRNLLVQSNNETKKSMREICSKLTIKTPEQRQSLFLTLIIFQALFWCFFVDFAQVNTS